MSRDLERYNHLNYQSNSDAQAESDSFIDFLYVNTEARFPEVNENIAWERFSRKLDQDNTKNYGWLKIAASIAIIFAVSITIYLNNSQIEQLSVASNDQRVSVTFPDGSSGILNESSSFAYPERFGDERRVSFSGEAYFDIKKSTKPFIIDANGVEVKVLGTAFNLITDDKKVSLYVDRGLVAFVKDGMETKIKAGKEAVFNKETSEVVFNPTPSVNIMSWRNGYFEFDKTPLNKALKELSEYYNVDFKFANDKLKNCTITVTIDQKSLKEALDLIEDILSVKTDKKGNTVKISGKGC